MSTAAPYVALALTGRQVVALVGDHEVRARWDATPLAFTILAVDRITGARTGPTLEPTVAATFLTASTERARVLAPAGFRRDHPFNVARRSASAGLLSAGRTGLVFGTADPYAPVGDLPWAVDVDATTTGDGISAERALERSWPHDSVVADTDAAIFVYSDRIIRVDTDGVYSIAGPLTIPEPAAGASVIGWYSDDPVPSADVDLTLGVRGDVVPIAADAPLPAAAGVLVQDGDARVADLLDVVDRLLARGARPVGPGPLRSVLNLPLPERNPAPAAFAAPRAGARL